MIKPLLHKQVVANQDSLIVEGEYEEIEEGIHASSRYSSFLNKKKSKSWSIEETRQFYKVAPLPRVSDEVYRNCVRLMRP